MPGLGRKLAQTFFTSPNFFNLDAAISKTLRITERFNIEIRADFLNATNHPDFSNATLDSNIDSSTFGRFKLPAVTATQAASSYWEVLGPRGSAS